MDKPPIKYDIYLMEIIDVNAGVYSIKISTNKNSTFINYHPGLKNLELPNKNALDVKLKENKYQLKKILNNKRPDTFFPGFKLKFILKDNIKAIEFNDLSKIIVLDRRNGSYNTYTEKKTKKAIFKIYTDGCYLQKIKKGAYVAIIKPLTNKLNIYYAKTNVPSSSLIELMAVIKGLEVSIQINNLRIITDSRYVIKGLTEWIFNWKLNDWYTAQGEKVKNIEYWKRFDELSKGKYIEFEWVKGHSEHTENSLCDYYAKQVALRH
ncbi:MAG: ribonuclease H [Bacteroidota bacterium]